MVCLVLSISVVSLWSGRGKISISLKNQKKITFFEKKFGQFKNISYLCSVIERQKIPKTMKISEMNKNVMILKGEYNKMYGGGGTFLLRLLVYSK